MSPSAEDLLHLAVRITDQRNPDACDQIAVNAIADLFDMRHVALLRPHGHLGDKEMRRTAVAPEAGSPDTSECPLIRRAIARGSEETGALSDGTLRQVLPVAGDQGELLALLVVDGPAENFRHMPLIRSLAGIYRNSLAILHYAEHDPLTGLKSRKTLDGNINRIIGAARALSASRPDSQETHHWLGVCDIDHFKRINDTYGHVFGDEVLLLFSTLMKQTFRAGDLLFRFGGEEFVVMLEPTTPERAARVFERFRAAVEAYPFPQIGRLTTSIGYVRVEGSDISASVLGQADEALYYAKNNGRNRVCSYESLIADGVAVDKHEEGTVELF